MADHPYGSGAESLTAFERGRLRPSVDVAALERWLGQTDGECRRALIAHFAVTVTEEELDAVNRELGGTEQEPIVPITPSLDLSLADHGVAGGNSESTLRFATVPIWQPIVTVLPPEEPERRQAWEAIERGRHSSC